MTKLEIDYVNDAISTGWGSKCYDYMNLFKEKLCEFFSVPKIWLTTSCHGALHTVLMAIDIQDGDEVIVPDYTWIGTANPVKWLGGKVVGCDVDIKNACIDVEDFKRKITPKTKAVMVVHIYGNIANLSEILKICKSKNIYVIEDCAPAFGSEHKGSKVGTIGDFGVFSFNATKMISTGEGGAIITKRPEFYDAITLISNQGRDRNSKDTYDIKRLGLKYNMTNIQSALGLAQLERYEEIYEKKCKIFKTYSENFKDCNIFKLHNIEDQDNVNNFWLPTILFNEPNKNLKKIVDIINKKGADIRGSIYTLSKTEPHKDLGEFPVSDYISKNSISLCSYEEMEMEEIHFISNNLLSLV